MRWRIILLGMVLALAASLSGCGYSEQVEEGIVISEAEQQTMIDEDEGKAGEALFEYLHAKYGLSETDCVVKSNEPEISRRVYSDGRAVSVKEPQYTGYYLAEVTVKDDVIHVKYSPRGETSMFPLGGGDDYQQDDVVSDIRRLVKEGLSTRPDRIKVRAGDVVANTEASWYDVRILGSIYDGKDYISPIASTPEGALGLGLFYENSEPDVDKLRAELADLFTTDEIQIVVGIHHNRDAPDHGLTFWYNTSADDAIKELFTNLLRRAKG